MSETDDRSETSDAPQSRPVLGPEGRPAEAGPPVTECESPPPAPQPPVEQLPDPRARLLQLAAELARSRNRRVLAEFLRLRRAI
jgi:hypothetical protein